MGIFDILFKPDVEKLRLKRDVKGLIKAIGYWWDGLLQIKAAKALGEIKDPSAVEPLIVVLKDKYSVARSSAAEALGKIKDPRAVEPLIAALKDNDSDVQREAAEVLVRIGTPATEPLFAAWKDESQDVRKAVLKTLIKICKPSVSSLIDGLWNDKIDKVECLIGVLKYGENRNDREKAAEALGAIKDPCAVKPLIVALKDTGGYETFGGDEGYCYEYHYTVHEAAKQALVKIGAPAVEHLIAALKDKD